MTDKTVGNVFEVSQFQFGDRGGFFILAQSGSLSGSAMLQAVSLSSFEASYMEALAARLADVRLIRTLGPAGTNCERAAHTWFRRRGIDGVVVLHPSLEDGIAHLSHDDCSALLGCAVYPDLHTLVFANLNWLALADSFVVPTYSMVLAARGEGPVRTVASHPAPQILVPKGASVMHVLSNVVAAKECAEGAVDACITTSPAAVQYGLRVLKDFGPVPMDFTIHLPFGPMDG